ncbi:DNA-3-methyladenine glycosylase I [Thauera humireducens]|uniref:DNA-3-methyladenine glycosylase I n=1 Tax=Thauera humireducens TaxID=1134435 RepID=UPI00311FEB84
MLKKQGWKFVGPTTMYAFMQAMGLVNDHAEGCIVRSEVDDSRRRFRAPGFGSSGRPTTAGSFGQACHSHAHRPTITGS